MEPIIEPYVFKPLALEAGYSPTKPFNTIEGWLALKNQLAEKSKYLVGSWGVWQPQAKLYTQTVEELVRSNGKALNILRLGLASPESARQEWALLKNAGVNGIDSKMTVTDISYTPLKVSVSQKISGAQHVIQADVRALPIKDETFDLVTSHFLFSYPQTNEDEAQQINQASIETQEVIMKEYRMKILKETYRTLKQGGVLLMAQGIKEQAGFWHSPGEIVNDLLGIGFTEVIVYPTTDPYDHKEENGKLVPIEGLNFIIVAKK